MQALLIIARHKKTISQTIFLMINGNNMLYQNSFHVFSDLIMFSPLTLTPTCSCDFLVCSFSKM